MKAIQQEHRQKAESDYGRCVICGELTMMLPRQDKSVVHRLCMTATATRNKRAAEVKLRRRIH